jgi:hypothetical protein
MNTYNGGMKKMPMNVAATMPPNTTKPTDTRLAAPAPEATISGETPRMKDRAVIITARNLSRAASIAAS